MENRQGTVHRLPEEKLRNRICFGSHFSSLDDSVTAFLTIVEGFTSALCQEEIHDIRCPGGV